MLNPMLKHFTYITSFYLYNHPNYNHSLDEKDESLCNF